MTHTDMPHATIRPATPADLTAIGRLGALLVRAHHDFDSKRFIAATTQTARGYSYCGVEGRDYMSLRGPAGVLYDIIVDPAHRGQGIGQMLLEASMAALIARGAPQIVLSTADRNENAQRLFARAGFRRTMIEMTRDS